MQLNTLASDVETLELEVYAESSQVVVHEDVVCEAGEDTGLADPGVSDEDQLEEIVTSMRL